MDDLRVATPSLSTADDCGWGAGMPYGRSNVDEVDQKISEGLENLLAALGASGTAEACWDDVPSAMKGKARAILRLPNEEAALYRLAIVWRAWGMLDLPLNALLMIHEIMVRIKEIVNFLEYTRQMPLARLRHLFVSRQVVPSDIEIASLGSTKATATRDKVTRCKRQQADYVTRLLVFISPAAFEKKLEEDTYRANILRKIDEVTRVMSTALLIECGISTLFIPEELEDAQASEEHAQEDDYTSISACDGTENN
ncbi:hypothetical protein QFC22_005991 [Naganishia vaughanmartiniae]|uniref:Uncharacterized protein n=1 Tax=Naganishia vaughanmartiniae TaxID=1424756 RepID=A0ACC2WRL3_9TREE|nr:hypothetical protein QFC22_005991 [Naganishia vaughanmartiniae]